MNHRDRPDQELTDYVPIPGTSELYDAVSELNEEGMSGLCPSFHELRTQDPLRYGDEEFLGQGALKNVYKTFDRHAQRWVAFARLRPDRGPDFFDHFVNEAWRIASLNHPNIIKVFDVGVDESERPYFTMDLKRNRTLQDFREQVTGQNLNQLLAVFVKVCDAIAYAHTSGVIHLDLKPDNIQCDKHGEVLVCDWGLAKALNEDPLEEEELTMTAADPYEQVLDNATLIGQVKGSLGYLSPEQLDGQSKKDTASDIYSLGCILHFILTGEAPYNGSPNQIVDATKASQIQPLQARFPQLNIPCSLEAVVLKATALDPALRYASVEDLQHEIHNYQAGYSTEAENPGFIRETALFYSRNRTPVTITLLSLITIIIVSAFSIRHIEQQKFATELERSRADQLGTNLEDLNSKHSSLIEEAENSKKRMARDFAYSAGKIKNLGIFDRPGTTVDEAKNLAHIAMELDATSTLAHTQLFSLDCLQLNYKGALSIQSEMETPLQGQYTEFLKLAQAFPNYNFNKERRPSINQLLELLHMAPLISEKLGPHLHRILVYDHARRNNLTGYAKVIEAFLQYQHGGEDSLKLSYKPEDASLSIRANKELDLLGHNGHHSYLNLLKVKKLSIQSTQALSLDQLSHLSIESLDLSQCEPIHPVSKKVYLPHLKTIFVSQKFEPKMNLKHWITTDHELTIHTIQPNQASPSN